MKEIIERLKGLTPRFFRRIHNAGLILTGISGALLTAPVALPAAIVTAAGYLTLAARRYARCNRNCTFCISGRRVLLCTFGRYN